MHAMRSSVCKRCSMKTGMALSEIGALQAAHGARAQAVGDATGRGQCAQTLTAPRPQDFAGYVLARAVAQ